jgi:mutator protein MutT
MAESSGDAAATEPISWRLIAAVLIQHGGNYLFIRQNKPGGAYPGTLHIPGGGLEPGEDPQTAARREVLEEVGLTVSDLEPAGFDWDTLDYKGQQTQLIFLRFTATSETDQTIVGSDAVEAIWVPLAELAHTTHNPATARFLAHLGLLSL